MANILGALALTSGGNSLRSINGNVLNNSDICLVVTNDGFYVYQLVTPDTTTQSVPTVITPALNGSNKRWHLRSFKHFSSDVEFEKTSVLKISEIQEKDTDGISFKLSDDSEMLRIDSDGVYLNKIVTNEINSTLLSKFILSDGNVSFTSQIKGVDPVSSEDLTTKNYVDTEITGVSNIVMGQTVSLYPTDFSIDSIEDDVVMGITLSAINTVSLSPSGSILTTVQIPSFFDITKDILINCYSVLTGNDVGEYVDLEFQVWSIELDSTPTTSDYSYTKSIVSSSANIDKVFKHEFTEPYIPLAILTEDTNFITIKITNKNTSSYAGTFDLVKLELYQN